MGGPLWPRSPASSNPAPYWLRIANWSPGSSTARRNAKPGHVHGSSDDYGFNVAEDGVHVHDLQATILHLLGIDHERLTYLFQGRQFRLTDVHGRVVKRIVAAA